MALLTLGLGFVVGISLALTGSGGTAFAVPLLVYGLKLSPHRAVCASMAAIGLTAALATAQRLAIRKTDVDLRIGLILALGGIFGAPAGAWLGHFIPEKRLLVLFAAIVLIVAIRMMFGRSQTVDQPAAASGRLTERAVGEENMFGLCDPRTVGIGGAGIITGVLAGLLGVGGGFLLVPVMVLIGRLEIHRAITTSQCVIAIISISAMASHFAVGQRIPLVPASLFAAGSVLGVGLGAPLATRISGPRLQRLFGVTLIGMALMILLHNVGQD